MSCPACEQARLNAPSGAYLMSCPWCMARLIASARPLRRLQEAHIEACRRHHRHDWQRVWDGVIERLKRNEFFEPAQQTCPQEALGGPRSDFLEGGGRVVATHPPKRPQTPQNPQQEELDLWEP